MLRKNPLARTLEPANAKEMLMSLVRQAVRTASTESSAFPQGLRVEVPVAHTDALAWLRAQAAGTRVYWASREHPVRAAGLGAADVVCARDGNGNSEAIFSELRGGMVSAQPNLRYYGGMAFDPCRTLSDEWAPFGAYRFTLPQFQLENYGTHSYLVCNMPPRGSEDCERTVDTLLDGLDAAVFPEDTPVATVAAPKNRLDMPNRHGWLDGVGEVLKGIRRGDIEKVVLARRSVFSFDETLDSLALLGRIVAQKAAAYQFYFQPEAGTAFMGATPERLRGRHGPRAVPCDAYRNTNKSGGECRYP